MKNDRHVAIDKTSNQCKARDTEINERIKEAIMDLRATIWDEILAELRGENGPSSIGNVILFMSLM